MKTTESIVNGTGDGVRLPVSPNAQDDWCTDGKGCTAASSSEEVQYSGPIPDPELLRAYEEISPGLAERIFQMAREEQAHHFRMEERKLRATTRGQYTAFIAVLMLIAAGVACALTDHHVVAGTIFTTTIIGTASVFLIGRKNVKEEEK